MWNLHRLCLTALLFAALNLSTVPICHGHGMPPPPPPPPGPGVARLTKAYPPRWSWLHWWEANRDSYIDSRQTDGDDYRADRLNKMQPRLVKELLDATASPIWQMRQAAALALGRMGETIAMPRFKALAHDDRNGYVRAAALLALSLLDNDQAESLIRDASYPTQDLELAALCGLGLHSPKLSRIGAIAAAGAGHRLGRNAA